MKIHLDSARDEPFRWQEEIALEPAALELGPEVELTPVAVDGSLTRLDTGYVLAARLAWRQTVPCDRCLAPAEEAIVLPLELLVVEGRERPVAGERELREEELGVVEVDGGVLDSGLLVAEQVHLNLPTHPLCRPDCAGLCPRCGANLNPGPCGCAAPPPDPRWAALAALRSSNDDDRD